MKKYYVFDEEQLIEFGFKCSQSKPGEKIADFLPKPIHIPTFEEIESEYERGADTDYDGMGSYDSFLAAGTWLKNLIFK